MRMMDDDDDDDDDLYTIIVGLLTMHTWCFLNFLLHCTFQFFLCV
jgi:hypothetical protein